MDFLADDFAILRQTVRELGATEAEIEAAAAIGGLAPLAVDLAMRPPGPVRTLDDLAQAPDLDGELVRRLWQALGLPEQARPPVVVPPDLEQAIRTLTLMVSGLGEDSVLAFARVIGSSVGRTADALAAMTRVGIELPELHAGRPYHEVAGEAAGMARDLLPVLWDAIGAVFRRHLVLVSYRRWSTDEDRAAVTVEQTVGFADLVGSTEVLRTLSVAQLAQQVDRFEQLVWEVVTGNGGRVVKLVGDEAMFVVDEPADACRLAQRMVEASPHPVRVGLAQGSIVALHGDCYGPTVNLAARLADTAAPSTVVVSESVAEAASGWLFDRLPGIPLRGFGDETPRYGMRWS